MLGLIRKMFLGVLTGLVNASSNLTEYVLLNNQKCMIQPFPINLHTNEYSQELHYCAFAINSDRCVGSCNILNDLPNKVIIVVRAVFHENNGYYLQVFLDKSLYKL